jgi:tetraacyldisaccharide 4'-kinase
VHALAGIGNPGRFFAQLRGAGLDPIEHPLPDHHVFTAADLAFDDELPVLMTEKDAVKCQAFADHRHCYVPVEASFGAQDAARLSACLESLCRQGERIR